MRGVQIVSLTLLAAAGAAIAADTNLTEKYRPTADKLIDAALADTEGYKRLTYLCYRIGNRLSGSPGLEKAIAWSVEQMKAVGLTNVQVIPTKVPHWVRGAESARMTAPADKPLHMLGLGGSIATPAGGITAEVVTVSDFNELDKLGREKVAGKIVLYNQEYRGYGTTVTYRTNGASRAAALGAVAALVDVGVAVAVAPRDVEAGQIVQHRLEIEIAAALDLIRRHDDDGRRRLQQALVHLRDRAGGCSGELPLQLSDHLDEARRILEPRCEVRRGAEQRRHRQLGRLDVVKGQ